MVILTELISYLGPYRYQSLIFKNRSAVFLKEKYCYLVLHFILINWSKEHEPFTSLMWNIQTFGYCFQDSIALSLRK